MELHFDGSWLNEVNACAVHNTPAISVHTLEVKHAAAGMIRADAT